MVQRAATRKLAERADIVDRVVNERPRGETGRAPAAIARQARSQSSPPGSRPKVTVSKPSIRSSSSRG